MNPHQENPNRSITIAEIADELFLAVEGVMQQARAIGIGVVDGGSKLIAAQSARLKVALAERRPGDVAEFQKVSLTDRIDESQWTWNLKKKHLWDRGILFDKAAMAAVAIIALASDATCVTSRKYGRWAVRIIRGRSYVWLARDRHDPRRAFIITAYEQGLPTPGDHATAFKAHAGAVDELVGVDARLALLPEVCA